MGTRSAAKAARKSLRKEDRNQAVKSSIKSFIRKAQEAIARGDVQEAQALVKRAEEALDKAAAGGVIHPNNAARRKSRLLARFHQAGLLGQGT